jgi:hypothetical protein
MFGHKWQSGEGTLVEVRKGRHVGSGIYESAPRIFVVDVRPVDGAPFRAELKEPNSSSFDAPTVVGEVVMLKCDPSRQEARFDLSDRDAALALHVAALEHEAKSMETGD